MPDIIIPPRTFSLPKVFRFGWGSVSSLTGLTGEKPLIITDRPVMEKTGHLDRVQNMLQDRGLSASAIVSVEAEPGFEDVRRSLDLATSHEADTILALGGGAVLDTAKAAWFLYTSGTKDIESFFREGPANSPGSSDPEGFCSLVAVPTTSGTGSEATCAVVFIDPDTGLKQVYISPRFIPTAALLDPALTVTMPPGITASSGFDALTHAIEAYITTAATPFSRAMAREAFLLIMNNLPNAFRDGGNRKARENMLYASSLAGIAISNSCTGLAHSLDQVGTLGGIPHGEALAALFLPTLRLYAESEEPGLTELAGLFGVKRGESPIFSLLERIEALVDQLHLPRRFSQKGISREQYDASIEKTIPVALKAFATQTAPVRVTEETMRMLLDEAY
jgi:alcohol dehydrogenase class IV